MKRISPYQTIITKVIPATSTLPARVKATASGGASITLAYDYTGRDHEDTMRALCDKLNWDHRNFYGGEVPNVGVVWVRVED
jgi:hypothetical protein